MTYQQRLERLVDVVQELSLARDLDAITELVRHAARELTDADGATFVMRDGDDCYYRDEEAISPLWKGQRFPMDTCISGWVMQHHQAAVIDDIYSDPRIPHDLYRSTFVKSLVMVPIRKREPIGAIGIYWASSHRSKPDDVHLLHALADSVSVALENVRIYDELERRVHERTQQLAEINLRLQAEIIERQLAEQEVRRLSLTDDLTGLYNRRGFFTLAEHELDIARRQNRPGALIFLDLDGLKRCNDTRGHAAGDRLLTAAADTLRAVFRRTDVLARLGGDEFIVLVTETKDGLDEVLSRLHDITAQVAQHHPALAFSIGVIPLSSSGSLDQLVAQADRAMYSDKLARRAAARSKRGSAIPTPPGSAEAARSPAQDTGVRLT